jgi:DNA-binding MarR family transcriptional regulator
MSDETWLDDTEAGAWRGLWAMSHVLFDRLGRALQQRSGLSLFEYDILVRLSAAPGQRLRMSELAAQTLSSRARLSYQIKGMIAASLVAREEAASDRRGAFAVLTARGRRKLEDAAPGHVSDVRRHLINALDRTQLQQLADIADAVESHLDELDERP